MGICPSYCIGGCIRFSDGMPTFLYRHRVERIGSFGQEDDVRRKACRVAGCRHIADQVAISVE